MIMCKESSFKEVENKKMVSLDFCEIKLLNALKRGNRVIK